MACAVFGMACLPAFSVRAAEIPEQSGLVRDYAGLFDSGQERDLEEAASQVKDKVGFDVAIVTTEDAEGSTAQEWADRVYEDGGFGTGSDHSGILYLIDMDNRELVFSTEGKAIRIFTDQRLDAMLDRVYEEVQYGDYEASARVFLEDAQYYGLQGIESGQYNYDTETGAVSRYKSIRWYELLMALAVSGVVAGGAAATVKKQYRMETNTSQLAGFHMAYRANSQFEFGDRTDKLIDTFVTTSLVAAGAAAAGAAAASRNRRGSRPAGRSSVHHSSGGRTHGGASRRF